MTTLPSLVTTSQGKTFHLTKLIGKGGEGAVYEAQERTDIALKLYWPTKAAERRDKVAAMASAGWAKDNSFVAFPIDLLFSPKGEFIGFLMKKIGGHKPVHLLFTPASRKVEFSNASFKFLIRAARNIARAVASVHVTGCVIGDVNNSGFLMSEQATSVLIDSDSFQVSTPTKNYFCQVGTPDYTPPELQGSRFDRTKRTSNQDAFGLAILIFQLLFMGRHPFSGRFSGSGDMPLERAIGEFRFAYSSVPGLKMQPPPGAPLLDDFPDYIGKAFEKAFGRNTVSARPSAAEWSALLERLENEIQKCSKDSTHQHVAGKSCPWCRMENSTPGFVAFNPIGSLTSIPIHIDVGQIRTIIAAIRDPGSLSNLASLVSSPAALSPAAAGKLASNLKKRGYCGIIGSASGAVLVFFGGGAVVPGLVALAGGLLTNILIPNELKKIRDVKIRAGNSWRSVQEVWTKQDGYKKFQDSRKEADALIQSLSDLPAEERRGVQQLEQKKRDAQLKRHLDRFLTANAKIKQIGSGRKAVLASWGVQTAADVDSVKISQIPGFGPSLVAELMSWRQGCVNKFSFNSSEPVNAADLLALRTQIANRRAELEKKVRSAAATLQLQSGSIIEQRRKMLAGANHAYGALKQAEADESSVSGTFQKISKYISLCCAAIAAMGLLQPSGVREVTNKAPTITAASSPAPARSDRVAPATRADVGNSNGSTLRTEGASAGTSAEKSAAPIPPNVPSNRVPPGDLDRKVFGPYSQPDWPSPPSPQDRPGNSSTPGSAPVLNDRKATQPDTEQSVAPPLSPPIIIGSAHPISGGESTSPQEAKRIEGGPDAARIPAAAD